MITAEAYKNAQVHTITVKNKGLFWVKMVDVQNELSFKNVPDLVRREMCGIFENKYPTEEQKRKYMRSKKEIRKTLKNDLTIVSMPEVISSQVFIFVYFTTTQCGYFSIFFYKS